MGRQGPIGTTHKQRVKFAWPRDTPDQPPAGLDTRPGQVAVNRNYVDAAIAAFGGGAPGIPPTPHVDAGTGLSKDTTVVPNIINLDPATEVEIGGLNEAPSDGQAYARQNVGWTPVDPGTPLEDGVGITIDTAVVPNVINLDPATPTDIGGITEPTTPQVRHNRVWDGTVGRWEPTTDLDSILYAGIGLSKTGQTVDLQPPLLSEWDLPEGIGGVKVPPRDATQGLAIEGDGTLRAPPANLTEAGVLTEPPIDGLPHARKFDTTLQLWVWEPTVAAGLQITSVIPDKCLIDAAAADITVNAYGSEFTPTCVIQIDGVDAPTQPDTETHCTFTVDPGLHPQYHAATITVHDPAVPEIGSGGEQFEFILQATDVLSLTFINPNEAVWGPGIAPLIVEAHGNQFTPTTVVLWDGVAVPTTQISNTELHFTVDPTLETAARTVPVTVADGAAGLFDASFYFRDARLAGETADQTGVVFIPPDRGLSYSPTTGELSLMPANAKEIGGIREPDDPAGQATWVRTGDMRWVPAPLPGQIAGHTPDERGIVFVPERTQGQGLTLADDGGLYLRPATDQHLGGMLEPSDPNKDHARRVDAVTGLGEWVEVEGGMEEPPMSPVALWARSSGGARGWLEIPESPPGMEEPPINPTATWGRSSGGARGWLEVPTFDHLTGFVEKIGDTMQGFLTLHADPENPFHAATRNWVELELQLKVDEPPNDDVAYARKWKEWVKVEDAQGMEEPPANPVAIWGRSSAGDRGWLEVPSFEHLEGFVSKIGDTMTGKLTLDGPPVNPNHAATKDYVDLSEPQEAPYNGKKYARQDGQWVEIEPSEGGGIEEPPMSPVAIWGRSSGGARGWLQIDNGNGLLDPALYVHVAGDTMQGTLTLAHEGGLAMEAVTVSQLETLRDEIKPLVPIGRSPVNGLENGYDDVLKAQTIWVPLATDKLAGSIVEPPVDGKQYVRVNDAMAGVAWVESLAAGVSIADTPPDPTTATPGALWFESDSGALFVFYDDGDSQQWVETGAGAAGGLAEAPVDGTPYSRQDAGWVPASTSALTEAPVDGTPYARQDAGWVPVTTTGIPLGYATEVWVTDQIANAIIDAQAFVTAAASKAKGHDTDLCAQALKAVEGLSLTVKRLERRVKTLEGRR